MISIFGASADKFLFFLMILLLIFKLKKHLLTFLLIYNYLVFTEIYNIYIYVKGVWGNNIFGRSHVSLFENNILYVTNVMFFVSLI